MVFTFINGPVETKMRCPGLVKLVIYRRSEHCPEQAGIESASLIQGASLNDNLSKGLIPFVFSGRPDFLERHIPEGSSEIEIRLCWTDLGERSFNRDFPTSPETQDRGSRGLERLVKYQLKPDCVGNQMMWRLAHNEAGSGFSLRIKIDITLRTSLDTDSGRRLLRECELCNTSFGNWCRLHQSPA